MDIGYGLPPGSTVVSRKAWFADDAGVRSVFVGRTLVFEYGLADRASHRYVAAMLARSKYATQAQVGQAFGMDRRSVNRLCQLFDRSGIAGFVRKPRSDKTPGPVCAKICRLRKEGKRVAEIAGRTGVSKRTVRTLLEERGYDSHDRAAVQMAFPDGAVGSMAPGEQQGVSAETGQRDGEEPEEAEDDGIAIEEESTAPVAGTGGGIGETDEAGSRAAQGVEAPVVLRSSEEVSGAGVLLALAGSKDVLESARCVYGNLQRGTYGLRSLVLGLLVMALLRVKSVESLKGKDPKELGRVLGQERIFEVKTLRRKLAEVGEMGKATQWHREIARRWVQDDEESVATLYVDGHTRAYYGKHPIAKGWCSRRRLCQQGTSDAWVNDRQGKPILRVSQDGHPALSAVLPGILADVRELVGEQECTAVFDRGGWSGESLRKVRAAGFHFITYRKQEGEPLPESAFEECVVGEGGRAETCRLAQRRAQLYGYGEVREVVKLCPTGKQICILTSRTEDSAGVIAAEIGGRWQQENFFKYMRAEYNLDGLVDYSSEEVDDREIPNPERVRLRGEIRAMQGALKRLHGDYAKLALNGPGSGRGKGPERMEDLRAQIRVEEAKLTALKAAMKALPKAVALSQSAREGEKKLSVERKLFVDIIKMAAYRADCALVSRAAEHLRRNLDEGHAFVKTVMSHPARLYVAGECVHVAFAPMSAPRFTRALQGLCDDVNSTAPTYPDTRYRLHFTVAPLSETQKGHLPTGPCQEF